MELDLVDSRNNLGNSKEALKVLDGEVGDT